MKNLPRNLLKYPLKFTAYGSVLLICSACGVNAGNPKTPITESDPELKQNSALELVSMQVDESTRMVGDLLDFVIPHTKKPPPEVKDSANANEPSLTLSCIRKDDTINSTLDISGSLSRTFERRPRKNNEDSEASIQQITLNMAMLRTVTSEWQAAGKNGETPIDCNDDQTVGIEWDAISTYHNHTNFRSSESREELVAGETTRESSHTAKGERSTEATLIGQDVDGYLNFTQKISQTVHKERLSNDERGNLSISTTLRTSNEKALNVTTKLDTKAGSWVTHIVQSGQIQAFQNDSSTPTLTTDFKDLSFAAETGCTPISGQITGVWHKEEEDVGFSIDFDQVSSGGSATVSFADGTAASLKADICDLETRRYKPGPPPKP